MPPGAIDTGALLNAVALFISPMVGAAIWWRIGRLEGRMNSFGKEWDKVSEEWRRLKSLCPLCSKDN